MSEERYWTDGQLLDLEYLVTCVRRENKGQLAQWGAQSLTVAGWALVLSEEVGELMKELCETNWAPTVSVPRRNRVFDEAIQVATLALKVAEMALREGA